MAKLNNEGREIWFSRVMWSYMPAHWKGVLYPALIVAVTVPLGLLAESYASLPFLGFVPLLSGWGLLMWLCERHSPSRPLSTPR